MTDPDHNRWAGYAGSDLQGPRIRLPDGSRVVLGELPADACTLRALDLEEEPPMSQKVRPDADSRPDKFPTNGAPAGTKAATLDRNAQVEAMVFRGAGPLTIARNLGVSRRRARQLVARAYKRWATETNEQLEGMRMEAIKQLRKNAFLLAKRGDLEASARLWERIARLLGQGAAPVEVNVHTHQQAILALVQAVAVAGEETKPALVAELSRALGAGTGDA